MNLAHHSYTKIMAFKIFDQENAEVTHLKHMPRGKVINLEEEIEKIDKEIPKKGVGPEKWYQNYSGIYPVSICNKEYYKRFK